LTRRIWTALIAAATLSARSSWDSSDGAAEEASVLGDGCPETIDSAGNDLRIRLLACVRGGGTTLEGRLTARLSAIVTVLAVRSMVVSVCSWTTTFTVSFPLTTGDPVSALTDVSFFCSTLSCFTSEGRSANLMRGVLRLSSFRDVMVDDADSGGGRFVDTGGRRCTVSEVVLRTDASFVSKPRTSELAMIDSVMLVPVAKGVDSMAVGSAVSSATTGESADGGEVAVSCTILSCTTVKGASGVSCNDSRDPEARGSSGISLCISCPSTPIGLSCGRPSSALTLSGRALGGGGGSSGVLGLSMGSVML